MLALGAIDRRILRQLQADGDLSGAELAERVGVAAGTVSRRLGRLERAGVIKGFAARIDWRALGYEVEVSLRVTLDKTHADAFDRFIEAAREIAEVTEIQTFLGRVDLRLYVIARDMAHYQEIYRARILALPFIADIEALVTIATVKDEGTMPL